MTHHYQIADFGVKIDVQHPDDFDLLPSFEPFFCEENKVESLLSLRLADALVDKDTIGYEEIGQFDCGGANHGVYRRNDGTYKFFIYNLEGILCCVFEARADFTDCSTTLFSDQPSDRSFGLNNALMIAFAFSSASRGTLMMHASVILHRGYAYLFQGKSGTGKSTHSRLWLRHIPNCELLNDDNPVVRIFNDGRVVVYGTPWSGKTPCYRNLKASAGAFLRLEQHPENLINKQSKLHSFASVLSSCSTMIWDKALYRSICDTVSRIAERVPSYYLKCLPDAEAAQLSHSTIAVKESAVE